MTRRRAGPAGFTLLELILAIAIIAIIGMGAASMIALAADAQSTAIDVGDTLDAGTLASDRIALELRELRGPTGVGLLSTGNAAVLEFVHRTGIGVRYALAGGNLTRAQAPSGGAYGPARILAGGVSAFVVIYRDASGASTTVAADVRRVEFRLDIQRGATLRSFGGQVFPRAADALGADWREP